MKRLLLLSILGGTLAGSATPAKALPATIDAVGCGTGCVQKIRQVGPVSLSKQGYPQVPVMIKTVLQPAPGELPLGRDKQGDPIVMSRGDRYPKTDHYWIIADCAGKRVKLYAKSSHDASAAWSDAYVDGSPSNCHSACGRSFDQWSRLCKAAGLL